MKAIKVEDAPAFGGSLDEEKPKASLSQRILDVEHRIADAIVSDVEHTMDDMKHLEHRMEESKKRHPNAWLTWEAIGLIALMGLLLAAQIWHLRK